MTPLQSLMNKLSQQYEMLTNPTRGQVLADVSDCWDQEQSTEPGARGVAYLNPVPCHGWG